MERRDFLETLGLGAAFVLTTNCFQACTKASGGGAVDFTLDLSQSANANLLTKGGYIKTNGVVVAQDTNGKYVAATQTCSHENQPGIYFNSSNQFQCSVHGALYNESGAGLNQNGSNGLTIYTTALSGTSLRVYGG